MQSVEVNNKKVQDFLKTLSGLPTGATNILVFQTDVDAADKVESISQAFKAHTCVLHWSIDIDDVDNVLRIEGSRQLKEQDVVTLVNAHNYTCCPL